MILDYSKAIFCYMYTYIGYLWYLIFGSVFGLMIERNSTNYIFNVAKMHK